MPTSLKGSSCETYHIFQQYLSYLSVFVHKDAKGRVETREVTDKGSGLKLHKVQIKMFVLYALSYIFRKRWAYAAFFESYGFDPGIVRFASIPIPFL